MKKVVLFIILFIPIIIVNADVQVNNENLKAAVEEYNRSAEKFSITNEEFEEEEFDVEFDFDNQKYYVINGDRKYEANYEFIENGVKVKYVYDVTKGLSDSESYYNDAKISLGQIMYYIVEYINGIYYDNSYGLVASYLAAYGGELNINIDTSVDEVYVIYDDTNDGVEVDGITSTFICGENQKCVPKSKYGDYAVEIAKHNSNLYTSMDGKKSEDGTVTVNYSVKTDTEDKFEMDCMLTINTDGSFEKLKASIEEQQNKDNKNNKDSEDNNDNVDNNKDTNTSENDNTNKDGDVVENPKTGIIDYMLYLLVILFIGSGLLIGIKKKNIFSKI